MNLNSVELTTTKIFFKEFAASTLRKRKITEIKAKWFWNFQIC